MNVTGINSPSRSYDADLIVHKFRNNPMQMLPIASVAMGFGFIEYVYCFQMTARQRISPFPLWMHAFYLAHDFQYVTLYHQFFGPEATYSTPLFQAMWFGMLAFNFLELHAIYVCIRDERHIVASWLKKKPVTVPEATLYTIGATLASFAALSTFRQHFDDRLMFCVFISTNCVMAVVPAITTSVRRKRVKGSLGLSVCILLGTIATFLPEGLGMYTTGDPAFFSRPWFFTLGAAALVSAFWHVATVVGLPYQEKVL